MRAQGDWAGAGVGAEAGQNGLGTGTVTFGSGALVDVSNSNAWVGIQYNPSGGYTNPTDYSPFILTSNNGPNFTAAMIVNTAAQLELINQNTQTLAASYALVQNIDLSSIANFVPIGKSYSPVVLACLIRDAGRQGHE